MKALYIDNYGDIDVMKLGEVADPVPGKNELLIRVKSTSVNPVDYKIRSGAFKLISGSKFPKIFGTDYSGIVEGAGRNKGDFQTGDKVYGITPIYRRKPGAHAELVLVNRKKVRKMPEGISFQEAASLPVSALTALNGLAKCGNLEGKKVLINGATGGVGHFALQIAKAKGARVTAVCSAKNFTLAKQLGADFVIDYKNQNLSETGKIYDVFFDAFGLYGFKKASPLLAKKGIYVTTLAMPLILMHSMMLKLKGGKQIVAANAIDRPEVYDKLEILLKKKTVKPVIEKVFFLEEAKKAYSALEKGLIRGKVVINVG